MRRQLPILAVTLACAAPAAALDLPSRKAGLWELRMSFEGRNIPRRSPSTASTPRPTSR